MNDNRNHYIQSSVYYNDDKDISDFLFATSASKSKLYKYLQKRGIYCSRNLGTDELIYYISSLPLDWKDTIELIELVDVRDLKDETVCKKIPHIASIITAREAFEEVQILRETKEKESYNNQAAT